MNLHECFFAQKKLKNFPSTPRSHPWLHPSNPKHDCVPNQPCFQTRYELKGSPGITVGMNQKHEIAPAHLFLTLEWLCPKTRSDWRKVPASPWALRMYPQKNFFAMHQHVGSTKATFPPLTGVARLLTPKLNLTWSLSITMDRQGFHRTKLNCTVSHWETHCITAVVHTVVQ